MFLFGCNLLTATRDELHSGICKENGVLIDRSIADTLSESTKLFPTSKNLIPVIPFDDHKPYSDYYDSRKILLNSAFIITNYTKNLQFHKLKYFFKENIESSQILKLAKSKYGTIKTGYFPYELIIDNIEITIGGFGSRCRPTYLSFKNLKNTYIYNNDIHMFNIEEKKRLEAEELAKKPLIQSNIF